MARYLEAIEDPSDDQFSEMFSYFANYLKAFTSVNEQTVASYLVVQEIVKRISALENPAKFTFAELYSEIENPREMYTKLKDTKNTHLKKMFLANIKMLPDWDSQYTFLFPTVLDKNLIAEIISAGKKEKAVRLVQDIFNDYRSNRNAVNYFISKCKTEEWFVEAKISEEKQLVTLVNIISVCNRE